MTMVRKLSLAALASSVLSPAAFAACDISETNCAVNGGKCNIKFRNVTGEDSGSAHHHPLKQMSLTQTIKVKALKENGNRAGNTLTIYAGDNKTMNVDKKAKKNFAKIRMASPNMETVKSKTMSCDHVKAVLNGNGTCKVFYGYSLYREHAFEYELGYSCDGGKVVG